MCAFNNKETETLRNKCQIVENIANLISRKSTHQGIKNFTFNWNSVVALSICTPILLQITFSWQTDIKHQPRHDLKCLWDLGPDITKTSLCNEASLTPHFYIVKLGFTGVYIL